MSPVDSYNGRLVNSQHLFYKIDDLRPRNIRSPSFWYLTFVLETNLNRVAIPAWFIAVVQEIYPYLYRDMLVIICIGMQRRRHRLRLKADAESSYICRANDSINPIWGCAVTLSCVVYLNWSHTNTYAHICERYRQIVLTHRLLWRVNR